MFLIPAITLRDGKVTRRDGKALDSSPLEAAQRLVDKGAQRLQLVDYGSLAEGQPAELDNISAIIRELGDITVQVVADIRDEDAVQAYLEAGVAMVVLGNRAASSPHVVKDLSLEYPRHIVMGIDVRDGRVVIDARSKLSNHELADLAEHYQDDGVHAILYREVDTEGRTAALNPETVRQVTANISIEVQAAGYVDTTAALQSLLELGDAGVRGLVIENPLDNGMDFAAATKLAMGTEQGRD